MIVVVQDYFQYLKIKEHLEIENFIMVFYRGRRITGVSFSNVDNIYKLILSFFSRERPVLVCEYANLIPRLLAFITMSKIHSHYFGYVYAEEIKPALEVKYRFLGRLITPLFADVFFIYGKHNPMHKLRYLFDQNKIPFYVKSRHVKILPPVNLTNPFFAIIGQPTAELGRPHLLGVYESMINYLKAEAPAAKLIYVWHPREERSKQYSDIDLYLNSSQELFKYMEYQGKPLAAFAIDSSFIHELKEFDITSHNFIELFKAGEFGDRQRKEIGKIIQKYTNSSSVLTGVRNKKNKNFK